MSCFIRGFLIREVEGGGGARFGGDGGEVGYVGGDVEGMLGRFVWIGLDWIGFRGTFLVIVRLPLPGLS